MTPIATIIANSLKKKDPIDSLFRTLTFIIIIRIFFEMLLGKNHSFKYDPDFYTNLIGYIHMYIFWLYFFLTISILIAISLKLKYTESLKLILLFSPIILIPPFMDFIFTGGKGEYILYSFESNTFFLNFINFFNPLVKINEISTGARIEIMVVFLCSFYASFYIFKKGLFKSLLFASCIYTAIFLYGYLPAFYKLLGFNFYELSGESVSGLLKAQKFIFMYLPPTVLLACALAWIIYRENKENLKSIIFFLYPGRLLFYLLLLSFGFLFVSQRSGIYPRVINIEDLLKLFSASISLVLLFVYAKIINDIHDLEIDRVSNKERPLVKKTVSIDSANQIKNILMPLSLLFSIISEISLLFYWFFIWASSYIYSTPPFRLRRFYPFGHITLAFIGLTTFLMGGALIKSYAVYITFQEKKMLFYIFSAFFFISHVKDFKDTEGDKAGGVYNLLNRIKLPRVMGIIFLSGFTISIIPIAKILNILNAGTIAGIFVFFAASTIYILRTKDTKKLDRLLLFSLLFSLFITGIWLCKITS